MAYPRLHYARLVETLLLAVTMLGALSSHTVYAAPLPHAVSGVLTFGDEPVMDHLLVEAKIDGRLVAATYTKDGRFGYDPYFKVPADDPFTLEIEGGLDGDMVQIYLDGEEILTFAFESGRISNFVQDISDFFNDPPVAYTQTSLNGVVGYSLMLDATGSYDPNTVNLTYIWHHDFGAVSTGEVTSVTYQMTGEYTSTLTVADPQGLEDSMNIEVTILPQPPPTNWYPKDIEGGKQSKVSLDEAASIWLTSLDLMTVSLLEFNQVFLDNSLPQINSGASFAFICDHSKLVYPVYFEVAVPKSLSSYDDLRLYSWQEGCWQLVDDSGGITGADRVWAYLDESSLGEGLYAIGYEPGESRPKVNRLSIEKEGDKYSILVHFDFIDPSSKAYLRIEDRLVAMKNIIENEVVFEVSNLKPGIQVLKVNGFMNETMIHSEKNIYLLFFLSALPVTLTSLVFKKFN